MTYPWAGTETAWLKKFSYAYISTKGASHCEPHQINPTRQTAKYQQFNHGGKPAMASESTPRIGDWYKTASGDRFEIVAQDEDDDTLELQYFDGTIEELDAETWEYLNPEPIEPPEDWTGSMDMAGEDKQQPEIWAETESWMNRLDQMDGETKG
jgi:hypothetical protein